MNASTGVKCNRIVGYLTYPRVISWQIVLQNGTVVYESGNYTTNEAWTFDLSNIDNVNFQPGTKFHVKVTKTTADVTSNTVLVYTPDSNATVYFDLYPKEPDEVTYLGVVPLYYSPNADPYLNCTAIHVDNKSVTIAKYGLYTLDGKLLYESKLYTEDGGVWEISFQAIGLEPGTLFKLHSLVTAGRDNTADVIMKYDPNSYFIANFELYGNLNNNLTTYQGTSKFNIKRCSNIVASNLGPNITRWKLERLDGVTLYTSDRCTHYETWKGDLSKCNLEPGIQFLLKSAIVGRDDDYSSVILEYHPDTATVYFESKPIETSIGLYYRGLIPSYEKPPVFKCSAINAYHDKYWVIMRWALITTDGKEIYKSGKCPLGESKTIDLKNLRIAAGVQLMLKAVVVAGPDSFAYMVLEYDPTSNTVATFDFSGNANKTIVTYEGSYNAD